MPWTMLLQLIPHVHPIHRQRIWKLHHIVVHVTLFTIHTRTITTEYIRFFSIVIQFSNFLDNIIVPISTFDLEKIHQVFNNTQNMIITQTCCDELLDGTRVTVDIGEGTHVSVDVGDEHVDAWQGELSLLTGGLNTTTGLPLRPPLSLFCGERHGDVVAGDGINVLHWGTGEESVGVGALGGEVSSRIAWLRTSSFGFVVICNRKIQFSVFAL